MKVVINSCYGGFSLSTEAEIKYLKRKKNSYFFYIETREDGEKKFIRTNDIKKLEKSYYHIVLEDLGKTPKKLNNITYFSCRDIKRNDPDLVAIVEELGEKANGTCAELKIIEIPDNIQWEINNYDGLESVVEKHRSWN